MADNKTDRIKAELLAIQAGSTDGLLHVKAVHAWAKANKTSALYSEIEWDTKKAAYEYQLFQIRRLVQLHVVTLTREPMLVSLSIDRTHGGGYRSKADIVQSRTLFEIMLSDALAELNRVRVKYEMVKALAPVWDAVKAANEEQEQERASA